MFTINETEFNYNIDDLFGEGNIVGNILKTRGQFAANPYEYKVQGKHLDTTMNNRTFIWMRDPNVNGPTLELTDEGLLYFRTPLLNEEENRGKEGSRFVLHTGTICVGFWYEDPILEKAAKYFASEIANENEEASKLYALVETNIDQCPMNALKTVLSRYLAGVEFKGNDIEVQGKKICGSSHMRNASGVHVQMGINFDYDEGFFKDALTEDEYHRSTQQGITGIKQELPNLSVEDFLAEWKAEIRRLLDEVEALYV